MDLTFCDVDFMHQSWNDVTIFQIVVIVWPKYVRRNHGRIGSSKLLVVSAATRLQIIIVKNATTGDLEVTYSAVMAYRFWTSIILLAYE